MTTFAKRVLQDAMQLPETDRANVAARLIASLNDSQNPEVVEAWKAEIGRRLDELDQGKVKSITLSEFWRIVKEKPGAAAIDQNASRRSKRGSGRVSLVPGTKSRRRSAIRK